MDGNSERLTDHGKLCGSRSGPGLLPLIRGEEDLIDDGAPPLLDYLDRLFRLAHFKPPRRELARTSNILENLLRGNLVALMQYLGAVLL